jgi:hypothetical protein
MGLEGCNSKTSAVCVEYDDNEGTSIRIVNIVVICLSISMISTLCSSISKYIEGLVTHFGNFY